MIGLGAMGVQMAKHMVSKGFEVYGYDISADASKRAEGYGVRTCGSVVECRSRFRHGGERRADPRRD